jgi:hypothetical protein
MMWVGIASVAVGAGTSLYSSQKGAAASKEAAGVQSAMQASAADEQRRQFYAAQELLRPYVQAGSPGVTSPYVQAGVGALQGMQDIAGLGGESQRQQAIAQAQATTAGKIQTYQQQRAEELAGIQKTFSSLEQQQQQQQDSRNKKKGFLGKLVSASLGDIGGVLGIKELQPPGIRSLESALADANLKLFDSSGKITRLPTKEEQQATIDAFNKQTQTQSGVISQDLTGILQGIQGDTSYADISRQRQQQAIQGIEQGPLYQELAKQGEQGILQNASATGGLRGGNTQAALGQFRPQLLNQLIEQQYSKLAGLTSLGAGASQNLLNIGQASAAGTAAAGQQSGTNIANLLTGQGQAQASGIIGAANAQAQGLAGVSSSIGTGFQNYMLMQQLNKPTMTSGLGTGGFAGSYQDAQSMYGGAPVAYQAPAGPGGPGGWYKQS